MMDKIEKIVLDRNPDFGDPIAVAVTDMSNITYSTGRQEPASEEVDGVTFTYQELDGNINSLPDNFSEPLVEYKPAGQETPEVNPDWHNERFYIRPNMIIGISLYTHTDALDRRHLITNIRFYVVDSHGTEVDLAVINDDVQQTTLPSRAIRFGYFKQRTDSTATPTGELSLGVFILTSVNETQHRGVQIAQWVSPNYWDGSFQPLPTTPSHARNSTPTGFSGGRSDKSIMHDPEDAYKGLGFISTTGSGVHVYKLSDAEYGALMGEVWAEGLGHLDDKLKNKIYQPTSGMLALHRLPIEVPASSVTGINICGGRYLKGNQYIKAVSSENQVVSFPANDDTWDIDLRPTDEWSMSFLDWDPYVLAIVSLPFIGDVVVNVNYFVYGVVKLRYIIDIVNGNCLAELFTEDESDKHLCIGRYAGNCAYTIPIFGNSQGGFPILGAAAAIGTTAAAIAATVATGGVAAPAAASAIPTSAKVAGTAIAGAAMAAKSITSPHRVMPSGSLPSNTSTLAGDLHPWLHLFYKNDITILDEAHQDMLQKFMGRESAIYCKLGALEGKGFISGVFHADDVPEATDEEKMELEKLLAEGVFWL